MLAPRRRRPTPRCLLGPRPTLAPATASHQPVDAASDGAVLVPLRQLEPLPTRPQGQPPRCQQNRCLHDCCAHSAGPGGGDLKTRRRTLAASARASSSAAPPRVESTRRRQAARWTDPRVASVAPTRHGKRAEIGAMRNKSEDMARALKKRTKGGLSSFLIFLSGNFLRRISVPPAFLPPVAVCHVSYPLCPCCKKKDREMKTENTYQPKSKLNHEYMRIGIHKYVIWAKCVI